MKAVNFPFRILTIGGLSLLLVSLTLPAQNDPTSDQASPNNSTATQVAPRLPYGVDQVLKLVRAQISEDVVVNYIQNSGTVYNLSPDDIVYLRKEGATDRVITAMLDQRKTLGDPAQGQASVATQPPPPPAPAPDAGTSTSPAPVYTQPAPVQTPPSSVYVIPYPPASSAYYGYYSPGYYYPYSYYGRYYGPYYGPSLSFGFGYGGGHWGGHYWGGHHWHH